MSMMNAAGAARSSAVSAAYAPQQGVNPGASRIVPLGGQRFSAAKPKETGEVPGGQEEAQGAAQAQAGAQGGQGAQGAAGAAGGKQSGGIEPEKGLALIEQEFGEEYSKPIIAPDGMVYMEARKPEIKDGKVFLRYVRVARIDKASGKLFVNPEFLATQKGKRDPSAKVTEVQGQYFYQTLAKGPDGQVSAKLDPIAPEELQKLQVEAAAQKKQQEQQAWNEDKVSWMRKLGTMSGLMKTVGYTGSMVDGMMQGPNPYTGKANVHWLSGYMILQILDSQAEGKLLPQWLKTGPLGTALDWGIQGYFMMESARDLQVLGQAFPRAASFMRTASAPTRAVFKGIANLGKGLTKAPAAAQAIAGAGNATSAAASATNSAAAAAQAAQGVTAAAGNAGRVIGMSDEVAGLGAGLMGGQISLADKLAVVTNGNALQIVPKSAIAGAVQAATPAPAGMLATTAKISGTVDKGMNGLLKALRPALGPLKIFGSVFGAITGVMNVNLIVKNQGVKALWKTRDGRGAVAGLAASTAFLGLITMPTVFAGLNPATFGVLASGLNLTANILSAVSMLNYAGLFGEGGFLDSDAVRAAFLIPPLTPLGLAALWMKRREKAQVAKAKQLELRKQEAVTTVQQLRQQAAAQIQASGQVPGGIDGGGGAVLLSTGISNDLDKPQEKRQGTVPEELQQKMRVLNRPMQTQR